MGMVGFTSHVLLSLFPLGKTFNIAISTIRSFATSIPVVSKSKKQIGRVNFNSIINFVSSLMFRVKLSAKLLFFFYHRCTDNIIQAKLPISPTFNGYYWQTFYLNKETTQFLKTVWF